jgi:hypothetical protein
MPYGRSMWSMEGTRVDWWVMDSRMFCQVSREVARPVTVELKAASHSLSASITGA